MNVNLSNALAIICSHCERNSAPIRCVVHTVQDGIYQFLCGADDHELEDALTIHISHVVDGDPSLRPLLDVQGSFLAERNSAYEEWVISSVDVDEDHSA